MSEELMRSITNSKKAVRWDWNVDGDTLRCKLRIGHAPTYPPPEKKMRKTYSLQKIQTLEKSCVWHFWLPVWMQIQELKLTYPYKEQDYSTGVQYICCSSLCRKPPCFVAHFTNWESVELTEMIHQRRGKPHFDATAPRNKFQSNHNSIHGY